MHHILKLIASFHLYINLQALLAMGQKRGNTQHHVLAYVSVCLCTKVSLHQSSMSDAYTLPSGPEGTHHSCPILHVCVRMYVCVQCCLRNSTSRLLVSCWACMHFSKSPVPLCLVLTAVYSLCAAAFWIILCSLN